MALCRIGSLPDAALAASARFHAEDLPHVLALLNPPRHGEGDHEVVEGHARPIASSRSQDNGEVPHHHPADGPPPRAGEEFTLVFAPADHTHRAWRLAAVQQLAREHAPIRVNAVESDDETAVAAAVAYLEQAAGVTGQYLPLDGTGAGALLS